ncbi:hypothetical protein [Parasphingorhabdus cellanae]|uniref:Uncharacterized protein n=1 Tax=Parasphingorhabdus cellanae TaxID=2806553 RepID=A0ABX7T583_9SPHN|nr:hypothetical protein [Parasphingorhabdus cellanae]QTD56701.1 hypothetical protein J4G78_03740 [Parasphingorhabdus cellanae]
MAAPLDQIIASLSGVQLVDFWAIIAVGIPVIIVTILRWRKPKTMTWSRENGLINSLKYRTKNATPEEIENMCAKMKISREEFEDLVNRKF